MEICGLGDEGKNSSSGESDARPAIEAAAQRHSFWHSGLNTAVRPGNEPATEGNGEKITGVKRIKLGRKNKQERARSFA